MHGTWVSDSYKLPKRLDDSGFRLYLGSMAVGVEISPTAMIRYSIPAKLTGAPAFKLGTDTYTTLQA